MAEHNGRAGKSSVHSTNTPAQHDLGTNKTFSWVKALPIMIAVAIVGVLIVLSTFAGTKGEAYVSSIYPGLLGRSASTSDIKYWGAKIDSGKSSQAAVFGAIYNSSEAQKYRAKLLAQQSAKSKTSAPPAATNTKDYVTKTYQQLYGRGPDAAGLAYWVKQIDSGVKTKQQVYDAIKFQADKSRSSASKAKAAPAKKLTTKQCRVQLFKDYNPQSDGGATSSWTNKVVAEKIVLDAYIAYTNHSEFSLSGDMRKQADLIESCQKRKNQLVAELKASPDGQARAAKDSDFAENVQGPINDAYMQLFLPAWESKGNKFTVVPWQLSAYGVEVCTKFMNGYKPGSGKIAPYYCFLNVGLDILGSSGAENGTWSQIVRNGGMSVESAINAITSGSAGPCPKDVNGNDAAVEEIFPSCANGGDFISQEDFANAKAAVKKQVQQPSSKTTQAKSSPKPTSGTMTNTR